MWRWFIRFCWAGTAFFTVAIVVILVVAAQGCAHWPSVAAAEPVYLGCLKVRPGASQELLEMPQRLCHELQDETSWYNDPNWIAVYGSKEAQ